VRPDQTRVNRYIAGWVVAAGAAVVALGAWTGIPSEISAGLLILLLIAVIAERVELSFHFERAGASYTSTRPRSPRPCSCSRRSTS
jgi:hypothetical protein